jgi:hypothetical protein
VGVKFPRATRLHNENRGQFPHASFPNHSCQEQIEMSGFVANELSAFSVLQGSLIFEQEVGGGRSHSSMVF